MCLAIAFLQNDPSRSRDSCSLLRLSASNAAPRSSRGKEPSPSGTASSAERFYALSANGFVRRRRKRQLVQASSRHHESLMAILLSAKHYGTASLVVLALGQYITSHTHLTALLCIRLTLMVSMRNDTMTLSRPFLDTKCHEPSSTRHAPLELLGHAIWT